MKKFCILSLLSGLFLSSVFSQEAVYSGGAGNFLKRIEYNIRYSGITLIDLETGEQIPEYNLNGKSRLGKVLLPDFNAPVEYSIDSDAEFRGTPSAIRIVKGPPETAPYVLEVKYITNWREVSSELEEKYPTRSMSYGGLPTYEEVARHNREMYQKRDEERYGLYKVETLAFPVRDLGDRLYEKTVSLIEGYGAKDMSGKVMHGHSVAFRCVVGDEVWTLSLSSISEGKALQMSDLFRQIIEDAMKGEKFDEWKYVRMQK